MNENTKEITSMNENAKKITSTNENKRVRRVGSITLGIVLIAAGICAIISVINPAVDIAAILRLSPAVLIILGIEILIASFINNNERIKYDGVSIFLCIFLIFVSIGTSVSDFFMPAKRAEIESIEQNLDKKCSVLLKDFENINYMNSSLIYNTFDVIDTDIGYADIYIGLNDVYADTAEFAAECKRICDSLEPLKDNFNNIHFYNDNMSVDLNGIFQYDLSAENIAKHISLSEDE